MRKRLAPHYHKVDKRYSQVLPLCYPVGTSSQEPVTRQLRTSRQTPLAGGLQSGKNVRIASWKWKKQGRADTYIHLKGYTYCCEM